MYAPEPADPEFAVMQAPLPQAEGDGLATLGSFSFGLYPVPGAPPSDPPLLRYHYTAARPDGEGSWAFADQALQATELVLSLRPSANCSCGCGSASVVFAGEPLANASVMVYNSTGQLVFSNSTDENGLLDVPGHTIAHGEVSYAMTSHTETLKERREWGNATYGAIAHYATTSIDVPLPPAGEPPRPSVAPPPPVAPHHHRSGGGSVGSITLAVTLSLAAGCVIGGASIFAYERHRTRSGTDLRIPLMSGD